MTEDELNQIIDDLTTISLTQSRTITELRREIYGLRTLLCTERLQVINNTKESGKAYSKGKKYLGIIPTLPKLFG